MPTIINNPGQTAASDTSGWGLALGILIAILVLLLIVFFAWPSLRMMTYQTPASQNTLNVQTPSSQPSQGMTPSGTAPSPSPAPAPSPAPSGGTSSSGQSGSMQNPSSGY